MAGLSTPRVAPGSLPSQPEATAGAWISRPSCPVSGWRCAGHEVLYVDLERFLDPSQIGARGLPGALPNQLSHPLDLVVLWTEPARAMVCSEPWSAPRQALLSGDRTLELRPGTSTRLHTRYAFTSTHRE